MSVPRFEWDERKNASNRLKHRVSFEEAQAVFSDEQALLLNDPDHSETEERFILLGFSGARILVVHHTYRGDDNVIRIISARRATGAEKRQYTEEWLP